MAKVLTALRGVPALTTRWAQAYSESSVRDGLIATVNNPDDQKVVEDLGGAAIPVMPYTGTTERERVLYAASLYELLIRAAKTEWVILWDDDIVPPWMGVTKLITAARKVTPDVAGVVTVYPYVNNPLYACLYMAPYQGGVPMSVVPIDGIHEVWGAGTGLSIWRRGTLLPTLPWGVPVNTEYGWDRDLAIKLMESEWKTVAECSIRSRHDLLP